MKDLNELLDCLDNLQDLPISEETIGAYMEGNLEKNEVNEVDNALKENNFISNLITDASTPIPEPNIEDFFSDDVIDFENIPFLFNEDSYMDLPDNDNYQREELNMEIDSSHQCPNGVENFEVDGESYEEESDDYNNN